jgi:hypothetical protein
MNAHDPLRRNFVFSGGIAAGMALSGAAAAVAAQDTSRYQGRTDVGPRMLDGQPVPEPPPEKSAGPQPAPRSVRVSGDGSRDLRRAYR